LSGVTYLLLTNSEAYEDLKSEVRSTFKRQEDINLISVNKLSYMLACLDEGMRMYPPIANGLPRVCPKGGSTVMGQYIPENVNAIINHQPMKLSTDIQNIDFSLHPPMGALPPPRIFSRTQ
jgi:cytochrome P450